jgi:hypothetical protein
MLELSKWLFGDNVGQIVFTERGKGSGLWVPGKSLKTTDTDVTRAIRDSVLPGRLIGFTQISTLERLAISENSEIKVHWVGIDIDAGDNPTIDLLKYPNYPKNFSARTSTSGKGVHLIGRLSHPITCCYHQKNSIIKALTQPYVNALGDSGVEVCKAGFSVFYMLGGEQRWLCQTPALIDSQALVTSIAPVRSLRALARLDLPLKPVIREWLDKLALAGFANKLGKTQVYIGSIVPWLRGQGQTVETSSAMSGKNPAKRNGFLIVTPDSLSLVANKDGRQIWGVLDDSGVLDNFFN